MNTIGIDLLHFYTPSFMVSLEELAIERQIDPDKYTVGIGQSFMSLPSPDEDIVTMGAEAAKPILENVDLSSVRLLLFATESGIDHSKAAGIWVHHLLNLASTCRVVELKQACYSATCALQMATAYVAQHPNHKALVIASDIARYGLRSSGEPTQGAGAVAMLVTKNPRLLAIEPGSGVDTSHVMDFWRPLYMTEALVDGKYSTRIYLETLERAWKEYSLETNRSWNDHSRFCFHTPFCKMADKAYDRLMKLNSIQKNESHPKLHDSLLYARNVGNCYTAALYLSLTSLLENDPANLEGHRIGCYSYGSGAVGEYFSCIVQPEYRKHLFTKEHVKMLQKRKLLSVREYEDLYRTEIPIDGTHWITPHWKKEGFRLMGIKDHVRQYERVPHDILS